MFYEWSLRRKKAEGTVTLAIFILFQDIKRAKPFHQYIGRALLRQFEGKDKRKEVKNHSSCHEKHNSSLGWDDDILWPYWQRERQFILPLRL